MSRWLVAGLVLVCSALCSGIWLLPREASSSAKQGLESRCERHGEARLEGGRSKFEGRVSVCFNGEWQYICIFSPRTDWTIKQGEVVCRSLNYSTTNVEVLPDTTNENETRKHPTYRCNGTEGNLTECDISEYTFECSSVGKLICQVPDDQRECSNTGEVRLVTGSKVTTAQGKGRVEVCSAIGLWGTICDDNWDRKDANVVCRRLGFNGTDNEAVRDVEQFGAGRDYSPVLVSKVECSGEEASIASCPNTTDHFCKHTEDAAVVCDDIESNDRGNQTTSTSSTCEMCTVHTALIICFVILGAGSFIAIGAVSIRLLVNRMRNKRRSTIVTAQPSEYLTYYPQSQQLEDDSLAGLRTALETFTIDRARVEIGESLGEGCFGTVHKGVCHFESEETIVAIKTLKSGNDIQDFIAECVTMKEFSHPNVLGLMGVAFDETAGLPLVILPFMANGDLRKFLNSKQDFGHNTTISTFPQGITLITLLRMCRDVACGMEYLAANKFVHRDLAARNCMVSDDLTVKVADFGLSRDIYSKDYYRARTQRLLPIKWMAPESLNASVFTEKSDVWAFGVVCWEVFSLGSTPYPGVGNHEVSDYIGSGRRLKMPTLCPQEAFQTMELCWSAGPDDRPDFAHLVRVFEVLVEKNTMQQSYYVNVPNSVHPQCNGNKPLSQ